MCKLHIIDNLHHFLESHFPPIISGFPGLEFPQVSGRSARESAPRGLRQRPVQEGEVMMVSCVSFHVSCILCYV